MTLRVALLCLHSSPLARIGTTDAGGMNVFVARLASELQRFDVEVDIFTRRSDPNIPQIAETDRGVRVVHLDAGPARALPKAVLPHYVPELRAAFEAFARVHDYSCDVVHSHYWLSGVVGLGIAHEIPLIHMSHTLVKVKELYTGRPVVNDSLLRFEGERSVFEGASAVVVATDDELRHIRKLYRVEPAINTVIPAGVDLSVFTPRDKSLCRQELHIDADRVLLFVGRMDPIKGIDTLLYSVAELPGSARNGLKLIIVSDVSQQNSHALQRYRRLAGALGLSSTVEFRDLVPHAELAAYYAAADVCAVPSAYETFGMVAVESMACGTPVVGFRSGGLSSLIQDGCTGFLASPGDRHAYARKLESALQNPDLVQLGERGRASVQQFTWPRIAGLTRHLYSRVLNAMGSRTAAGL